MDCIGVFDSGVGGISVLKALVKELPNENFLYYGDSANAPYGTKSLEEVRALSVKNTEYLLEKGAKAIVVACNTATSASVRMMRSMYPGVPIIGIEPALKPAVEQAKGGRIVVLATPMTIREEKFKRLLAKYESEGEIIPVSCPGLMEYVEQGITSGGSLDGFLDELLGKYKEKKVDAVVLGCTHYPFVADALKKCFGEDTMLFEGGPGVARETKRRIKEAGKLKDDGIKGKIIMENSSSDLGMIDLSWKLLEN